MAHKQKLPKTLKLLLLLSSNSSNTLQSTHLQFIRPQDYPHHNQQQGETRIEICEQVIRFCYRDLLKAIKKHIGKEECKRHFGEHVTQEFRKNCALVDQSLINQKIIRLAHDYTVLLNSVHHHADLLFSYNIAVDRSDEMKRILGKSASSVGLQLPEVYEP